ncbi:hypothetical protein OSB04_016364 [Centaurea solstitialis]|uniref:non-specific serine/threonine protein kinase n=1 Tax=Centaurea solstitialis TaxID=347529 RepID=A0AA38WJM4_9ASTR|nr:hypothetical protein OSB04_016364 [Centaurea solstitialis]
MVAPGTPHGSLMTPTELEGAFHTMHLQPPDNKWYMDTGSTAHLTSDSGKISNLFCLSKPRSLLVGNGYPIPIIGHGSTTLSHLNHKYYLNHVYHVARILKNLISVRKFTRDNNVSVEFDPFGFSVKHLKMGRIIMRCNSSGERYPISVGPVASSTATTLLTVSPTTWHNHLGHPGISIFNLLQCSNSIPSRRLKNNDSCNSCSLGKHCRLRFFPSISITYSPFDIIHTDLWTSPITSKLGHKYYLVLLDDYSHFIWTFPLQTKSQVFPIFLQFYTYINTQFGKKIKSLQCDNGREFHNSSFHTFCVKNVKQTFYEKATTSITFNFTDLGQDNLPQDIQLTGHASSTDEGIQLTPLNAWTAGRATYVRELHLWDKASGELASFTTDFSFVVDSMSDALYADVGSMGLPANDDNQGLKYPLFVAVEFDSYGGNYCDGPLVYGHVGIDINNLSSVTARKWYSNIPAGELCKTRITYDSASKKLAVSFTGFQHNYKVASQDLLEYTIDLRGVLPERVIFGFSAATGTDRFQRNNVKSWAFSSSDLRKSPDPVKGKVAIVVGLIVAFSVLITFLVVLGFFVRRRKKKTQEDEAEGHGFDFEMNNEFDLGNGPTRFSYLELAGSTGDFAENEKLGEGGFGGVYKGFLKDSGTHVAVKRVSKTSKQGIKEYSSEVRIISRLRHRNLVQLIGWCHEKRELLLVYEFMENGSLDSHIFKARSLLTWGTRYKIAHGLASALLYLHEEWEQCVLHRDIKSSNVMLDSNFNVKLCDFGLAKLVDHEKGSQTTLLAGTLGYMAPECALTGKASKESDVFSFRVVALEIACGRKPINYKAPETQISLVQWVRELYATRTLLEATDPRLRSDFDEEEMTRLMIVGLWCVHPDSNLRPSMRQAIQVLNFEASLPTLPSNMLVATYLEPSTSSTNTMSSIDQNQWSNSITKYGR